MTNWKGPAVITAEYYALVKLYHVIGGVLIWEFVVNIGFEYSVFTRKRKFRSSFLLYLGARWFPLFTIIGMLVRFDSANRINCQAHAVSALLFPYLSMISASALIVLRIAAIWGLNKVAISIASAAWLANTGSLVHGVAVIRATWSGVLLLLMLTGLLRWENAHQRGGVWWLLYTQGLAWMMVVVVAEALVTVFVLLNLNDPVDRMFQVPALITMTICASRVYRGLANYFLHDEANTQMSGRLSGEPPIRYLVPHSDQSSLALGPSGMPDSHMFGMDPLAPPKRHFRPGEHDEVWRNRVV
ncbi:hypothetical protein EDB89DRAFT_735873 [Lactarius sanguifluus]|nr:hypothetical protein EDB89DRAFT_735873 [Lactarius sanguifluus]